jgi:hypothetical protein
MWNWFIRSALAEWLFVFALRAREARLESLGIFNDAEAKFEPD